MVDKLLLKLKRRSKKLPTGSKRMAIKNEKSNGAKSECPKMAIYVRLIKQKSTSANFGRKVSFSLMVF